MSRRAGFEPHRGCATVANPPSTTWRMGDGAKGAFDDLEAVVPTGEQI
jgi:hypothetical protein